MQPACLILPHLLISLLILLQLSTAAFLFKFWRTLPAAWEQAYFGALPPLFAAHAAWRWRAPRHYLAWRSLSAAFWALEPLLPYPCWRGWALCTVDNTLPLLAPGRRWWVRAGGAASLLALSSLALPLALLGMARPLPALLHVPVQGLAVAAMMRRNPAVCSAIVLAPQPGQPAAAAAALAVVRGAHRACSLLASAVTTAALLLAGQPPTRLLAQLQVRPRVEGAAWGWLGLSGQGCHAVGPLPFHPRSLSCMHPVTIPCPPHHTAAAAALCCRSSPSLRLEWPSAAHCLPSCSSCLALPARCSCWRPRRPAFMRPQQGRGRRAAQQARRAAGRGAAGAGAAMRCSAGWPTAWLVCLPPSAAPPPARW